MLKTLRFGATGTQVELLQLALNRAGLETETDGKFGASTRTQVLNFQRRAGILQDGIVGSRTWNALEPYLLGYVRHTISKGDTLYDLSLKYGADLLAVETANPGVDPLNLQVGRVITIPLPFEVVPANISFTSLVLSYSVRGLKARYPFLRSGLAGGSIMGKPLVYLAVGDGPRQVFYNASHHANEWITSVLLMTFLERYADAYTRGSDIAGYSAPLAFSESTLFVMPMVDPDGVDLVTGELTGGIYYDRAENYAADYPAIPFPDGWKANVAGIDLNLQYPAGWEDARRIKFEQGFISPAPRDYVGSGPLTAPESRAVYDFTRAHNFEITLSYHTQGRVIYWKYLDREVQNSRTYAQLFSKLSGYSVEDTPYASGFAGYKDWFIDFYARPGFTIEAGLGTAPLPLSQFPQIYAENKGILMAALFPLNPRVAK